MKRWVAAAALSAALAVASGASADPASLELRAPHLQPDLASPEGGLWDQSDHNERHVKASAELDRDPVLTAYVAGVVRRIAPEYDDDLRIYVLDRPYLNAAAAPNGYVEVWSGLLLRARDEDELAFVLGHEVSHFARNHILARWRSTKNTANATMLIGLGIGVAATAASYSIASSGGPGSYDAIRSINTGARDLIDLTYLVGVARLFAFDRSQESEADRLGFGRAVSAGYDPAAGQDLWLDQMAETGASDFKRVRDGGAHASIFDSHPVDGERVAALGALGAGVRSGAKADAAARYRAVIRPHLAAWLKDDLRRRDWGQSLHLISRLEAEGEDLGVLNFYRGEAYRQRRGEGDALLAQNAYRAAVTHADAPAAAWRELGEASRKLGDKAAAREAFGPIWPTRPTPRTAGWWKPV